MAGNELIAVIVDDPHGMVAPSAGVKVLSGKVYAGFKREGTMQYVDLGELSEIKTREQSTSIDLGPMRFPKAERKRPRKPKQKLKGLRP